MRKSGLLLLVFLLACGDDESKNRAEMPWEKTPKAPQPVAEGMIRVRHLDPVPEIDAFGEDDLANHRWAFDWLESEGWRFSGWAFEAGSDGEAAVRWHDPRRPSRDFGTVRFGLSAGKPVSVHIGVKATRLRVGPKDLTCPGCGRRFKLHGSLAYPSIECRSCGASIPTDPEWEAAPKREFRIALLGDMGRFGCSKELVGSGPMLSLSGALDFVVYVGALPRGSEMTPGTHSIDPYLIQSGGESTYAAGKNVFSCRYQLPGNLGFHQSTSSNNRQLEFAVIVGDITIAGTNRDYTVSVGGKRIAVEDYPLAVWEFELEWKPSGNAR